MAVRIGVDFDGVLADTQGFVIRFVREQYDVDLARGDFGWRDGRPAIEADLGVEVDGGFQEFASNPEYVAELDPLPGARDALWSLVADPRFDVSLASHRPPAVHDAIERWLADSDLPALHIPPSVPEAKATATPSLDVLVDDYHGHVDLAAREGLLGVHLTTAWESGEPGHPAAVRATTWDEALAAIVDHADR